MTYFVTIFIALLCKAMVGLSTIILSRQEDVQEGKDQRCNHYRKND
ncbi:MAG: hypothetical protein ACR2M8_02415 [Pyrinomonadaceae bacterium]